MRLKFFDMSKYNFVYEHSMVLGLVLAVLLDLLGAFIFKFNNFSTTLEKLFAFLYGFTTGAVCLFLLPNFLKNWAWKKMGEKNEG